MPATHQALYCIESASPGNFLDCKIITTKGYKAKSAKRKGELDKVQGKQAPTSRVLFQ